MPARLCEHPPRTNPHTGSNSLILTIQPASSPPFGKVAARTTEKVLSQHVSHPLVELCTEILHVMEKYGDSTRSAVTRRTLVRATAL